MTARNGAAPHRRLAPAACVLLALAGLAPASAQAQVDDYISNLKTFTLDSTEDGNEITTSRHFSQEFRTGSRSGGYPLSEVVLGLTYIGTGAVEVTIRENLVDANERNVPGTTRYTLTSPSPLSAGRNTFTAPPNATLEADTAYHIVAESTSGSAARWINIFSHRYALIDNAGGWDINFDYLRKSGQAAWSPVRSDRALAAAVRGDDDSPTTGSVAVTGTAAEGGTLTADTSGLTDADGLDSAAYAWQWVRTPAGGGDEDISGATSRTYVPVYADAGATLKVRVAVTDDKGHEETFESAPTPAVAAAARPSVTVASDGDVTEGGAAVFTLTRTGDTAEELDVAHSVTATGDFGVTTGAGTATFPANNATVRVSVATTGDGAHEAHGSVTVALTADTGADPAYLLGDPAAATAAVEDDDDSPATGSVAVTGTPTEGGTLTADTSGLTDGDGLANAAWAYQWVRTPPGGGDADISGATSRTYVPVYADAGATLKVRVTVTDDENHEASFASAPTPPVAALPRPSVTVASAGNVTEGSPAVFTLTRTGDTGQPLDVAYEVAAAGDFGVTPFSGTATFPANGSAVQVSVATTGDGAHEAHGSVTVALTADTGADPAYLLGAPAAATAAVGDDDDSPATGSVTVTGTAREGQTLTADTSGLADGDGLANASHVWQWVRTPAGGSDADISGATSKTYSLNTLDVGATLKVRVTVTDDEGHEATFTSAPTAAVAALPEVSVMHGDSPITEGGVATFTFTLSKTIGDIPLRVNIRRTETGNMMFPNNLGRSVVVFGPNQTTLTVSYPTVADDTTEPNSTVTVEVLERNYYKPGTPSMASVEVRDDDDSPATGTVTVTGTPAEGGTLTADTSGLTDADGLDNAAYAWQWVRTPAGGGDADISGATSRTYVPVYADAGATLKVRVTVTDDEGHEATFTSAPTPPVAAAARPSVTVASDGDVTEGGAAVFTLTRTGDTAEELDVAHSVTATGDFGVTTGAGTATFPANNATVRVSVATTGDGAHEAHGSVTVALTADTGADPAYLLGDPAAATAAVEDDDDSPATGSVAVTGTAAEGGTLTADTSGLTDADGLANAAYAWQWVRTPAGGGDEDISGATSRTYVPVYADAGATLKVRVTVTDDEGHEATFTSAPTPPVAAAARPSVTVASDGDVTEGGAAVFTLTRTGDTAEELDVAHSVTATGDFGVTTGAGTATFPANNATVRVSVATTGDGAHEAHGSVTVALTADTGADPAYLLGDPAAATAAVEDDDDSPATGSVAVTGTAAEGGTLTADTSGLTDADGLDNAAYAWQWVRTPAGGSDEDISGATSRTYVPVYADAGATLKVRVAVTDDEGHEATFESAPTPPVAAAARPSVTVASDGDVTEGGAAVFTLTRTGDTAEELDVAHSVTATGDFGITTGAGTATFPANGATVRVSVATTGDGAHEAHGSVTVALTADTGADPAYLLGDPAAATAAVEDDDDSPATGSVAVTGTAAEGGTLTADTSGLTDADGLDNAAYVYQWVRTPAGGSDEDISGATSRTYVPVYGDAGATLKVRVAVTDDEGHEATFTSAPTPPVAVATRPSVTVVSDGDVTEGGAAVFTVTRTGDTARTLDVDYEVTASGDFGVTAFEATLAFLANSAAVQLSVPTTGDGTHEAHGSVTLALTADTSAAPAYLLGDPAAATAAVEDDDDSPTTGAVTVTGTAREGETLTADTSGLADGDGLDSAAHAWQWVRTPSGGGDADISGATSRTYVPVFADAGATLKVRVTVTDDEGHEATFTSVPTAAVAARPRPEVTVASDGDVTEGSPAAFTLTRTGATTKKLGVAYEVTATGAFGAATGAGTATFPANGATVRVSVATTGDGAHEAHGSVTVALTADTGADPAYLPGDPAAATAAVRDDDNVAPTGAPTIDDTTPVVGQTLTADASGIGDADGTAGATYAWRWLRVATGGGETEVGTGATYAVVAGDAGSTLKVEARFTDDGGTGETVESAETSAVEAAPRPRVSVARVASAVAEGAGARFTVTRTGVTTGTLTVRYDVSESGAMVASGEEGAKSVAFADGDTERTVTVPTADDSVHEADSVVTVALTADAAYDVGTATATVTVEDNDNAAPTGAPTIDDTTPVVGETLTADPSGIADPDGTAGPTYAWRWLRVASGGGETQVGTGTSYTVVAGDVGATLKVEASFTDDDGTRETVESAATATVEAAPVPTVSVARVAGPVSEGAGAQFTVTRTGVTEGALTVRYDVSESGAMVASGEEGAKSVAFADGDTERTVTVPTADDNAHEADSVVTLTLAADAAWNLGTDTATVTVEDDDNAAPTGAPTIDDTTPVVGETLTADASGIGDPDGLTGPTYAWRWLRVASGGGETEVGTGTSYTVVAGDVGATLKVEAAFTDDDGTAETVESAATATVAAAVRPRVSVARVAGPVEEGEDARFRVTRTGVTAGALTVRYSVSETGAMVASGEEGARTVAFGDGDTGKTVTVPTVEDSAHEADSVVTLTLTADAAYDLGTAAATVTVEDDDNAAPTGAPTIDDTTPVVGQTLTADASGIGDADGTAGAIYAWQWIRTSGGTDTRIGGATAATYTVADADAGATLKAEVAFTDDDGTRETVESAATATVAPRPTVTLVLTPDSVTEAGGESVVTARLDRASGADTTVTVSAAPVAPATEADYRLGANRVLTIAAGGTESVGRVTVTAVNNAVDAPDRAVTVTGKAANRQGLAGDPEPVTLTIRDNDAAPTVTLHLSRPAIVEDGGTTAVTARLSHPSSADTTVTVEATLAAAERLSVAATEELPYVLSDNRELRIPAGGTESVGLVTITAVDNDAEAPDRKVTVTATAANAQGVAVPQAPGAPALAATLTIADDEGRELSIGNARAAEGSGAALRFAVTLEPPAAAEVTVDWTVFDGTARAGKDHGAGSGTLTFGAGESAGTVTVAVTDDDADEPDETVTVVLSNPSGATVARAEGTGTITDDDAAPAVSLRLTPDTIAENGGTATVTARLDRPSSERTTVTVSAAPVAPATAADYRLGANRVLTVAAGERESAGVVTIAAVDNDAEAPDRTVTVSGKATNRQGLAGDPEPVTLTIADDELVEERRRRLGYALAAFGRAVARDLVAAVEDRPRSARAGTTATLGGTPLVSLRSGEGVHGALRRYVGSDGDLPDGAEWRELLSRSSFQLSLGGEGEAGGAGVPVLWGRGSLSRSAGRLDPEVTTRGETLSGQLGLELRVREDTLLGVMLSGSSGEVEFDGERDADVETELVGVHPYARWSPRRGLRTWAMLGYGTGEAVLRDGFSTRTGTGVETDIEMTMAAGGGSNEVASLWGVDWSVGTSGFLVQLDADGQAELLPALESGVWQARLLLEGSAGEGFGGVEGLRGNVELAARVDGGDAESGMGVELGGGVGYGHADLGLEVEASGRVLLSHEEEGLEDAGVRLGLEFDPGASGRGLYFALTSSWGNAASGARSVWEGRRTTAGGSGGRDPFDPEMRLSSEFGHAAPALAGRGTLTTYGAFSSDGDATHRYRVGRRLELDVLSMSLEAELRESADAAPGHGVRLTGSIRF